ncbi:MAG: hypothetical protein R6W06_02860 [Prochlorococcaceae cyanobacterium]
MPRLLRIARVSGEIITAGINSLRFKDLHQPRITLASFLILILAILYLESMASL